MFNDKLKSDYSFIAEFFSSALSEGQSKLAQAYMLTGSGSIDQYFIAMEVARVLNCEVRKKSGSSSQSCTCTNCNWIRQNRHPAVVTISPVDYTYGNKDGKAMTVISVNQARYLKDSLSKMSNYYRVIIFTDAKEGDEYEKQSQELWHGFEGIISPPAVNSEEERAAWHPASLNRKVLSEDAANTLLKIVEEPPPNLLFFFLTRDKEDVIETIVSRAQVLHVVSRFRKKYNYELLGQFFDKFPPKSAKEAILFSERFMEISKEESCSIDELLDTVQDYLGKLIKSDFDNNRLCAKLTEYIKKIEQTKLEIKSNVNINSAVDSLFLRLVQE